MIYDAIVAGGGPAGAVSAYFLARKGLKVLLLEKDRPGRYKCCAGGVTSKIQSLLDFDLSPCWETSVRGVVFSWLGEERHCLESEEELGWVTRREVFDFFLQEAARRAGTEIRYGEPLQALDQDQYKVTVHTPKRSFSGRILVGADGAKSQTASLLKLKTLRASGFALEARLEVSEQTLKDRGRFLYFDLGSPVQGYCWIFPRRDHLSAGVAARRPPLLPLRIQLKEYLEREGLLDTWPRARVRGGYIRSSINLSRLHRGRCLLAGDAAGLCDRLTGEGIYPAALSGRLAAEAITAFLSGEKPLEDYKRLVRARLGSDLFWANLISRVLDRFPRKIYEMVLSSHDRVLKLSQLALGRTNYRRLVGFWKK